MSEIFTFLIANEPPAKVVEPSLRRAQSLVGTSEGRPHDDFYRTPREATEALLSVEEFHGSILEPACGDGAISTILLDRGHTVISTDLVDRGFGEFGLDFTVDTYPYDAVNVITNPPFKLAEKFAMLALRRSQQKVCLLCKVQFLEGVKRRTLFESTPLKKVWVFSKRITMARNGEREKYSSSMMCFCWFVWEHGYCGAPMLGWL